MILLDSLDMVIGAALLAVGWVTGRFRRPAPPPADPYHCSCGHSLSHHSPNGANRCEHVSTLGGRRVMCTCAQYIGERPFDMGLLS